MLPVKVKTEKTDLETMSARNRLDAVLQFLMEKSDVEREQMEDEASKQSSDLHKDSSPTATGKRPSSRFPQHRRKKRKEMEDGIAEGSQQKQNTYIIKLFDRSVDLAQFNDSTPLYPICRAWMRNNPSIREGARSPSPPPPPDVPEDEEVADVLNGKSQDICKLPAPVPSPINHAGEPINLRIPSPLPCVEEPLNINLPPESVPTITSLIYNHMERWKKIRQRWKESSHKNQLRYSESMEILKEMYERQ
ncbi:protein lin-37 homolog isoform X2 [Latimeria chalumnae]|uniref:protein lin-37 homolog isoform X2 n=1 Tax=Latimeria chalumnae TaxID=7897 RepID=UPI00313D6C0B